MAAAKSLGHQIFSFEREMPRSPIKSRMVEIQKQIYSEGLGAYEGRAANASKTLSNSTLSTGSAFSRTSEGLRDSGSGPQAVAERQSGETVTGTEFQSKNMVPGGKDLKSNFIKTSEVYREPVDSLVGGVFKRAMDPQNGRTVALDALVKGHAGSNETVLKLQETFAGNPLFGIVAVDNSRGIGNFAVVPLEDIPVVNREGLKEKLQNATDKELESKRISQAVYDSTTRGFNTGPEGRSTGQILGDKTRAVGEGRGRDELEGPSYSVRQATDTSKRQGLDRYIGERNKSLDLVSSQSIQNQDIETAVAAFDAALLEMENGSKEVLSVPIGRTPHVLSMLRQPTQMLKIDTSIIKKVFLGKHAEEFGDTTLRQLILAIYQPAMVLKSKTAGEYEIVTSIITPKGPVIVPIQVDSRTLGGVKSSSVKSIYGKKVSLGGDSILQRLKDGALVYADPTQAQVAVTGKGSVTSIGVNTWEAQSSDARPIEVQDSSVADFVKPPLFNPLGVSF